MVLEIYKIRRSGNRPPQRTNHRISRRAISRLGMNMKTYETLLEILSEDDSLSSHCRMTQPFLRLRPGKGRAETTLARRPLPLFSMLVLPHDKFLKHLLPLGRIAICCGPAQRG